jgi:nucleoside-diphosphate-sugar epimerase
VSTRWVTPFLGTCPAHAAPTLSGFTIIDVRDLVDKSGNSAEAIRCKIEEGCESLRAGGKVIVCCDHGISRSNAVAAGILSEYEGIPFESAIRRVLERTGERDIKLGPLQAVRAALRTDNGPRDSLKRSILVTGASGTIGALLRRQLAARFQVVTPSSAEIDLRLGGTQLDLTAGETNIECIVHLASPRVFSSNVATGETITMLRNVLDVCVSRNIKLIYLSSTDVYAGYRSGNLFANESTPLFPRGPYGEAKYLAETLIEYSRREEGLRATILRCSPAYGVGSGKPKFIHNFIEKVKRSESIVTHRYKNGPPALDLLYIDDLVAAVKKSVESDLIGNFNIGTGTLTTIRQIADVIVDIFGSSINIESNFIDNYTSCIAVDPSAARERLGWQARIGVEDGLRLIISEPIKASEEDQTDVCGR